MQECYLNIAYHRNETSKIIRLEEIAVKCPNWPSHFTTLTDKKSLRPLLLDREVAL